MDKDEWVEGYPPDEVICYRPVTWMYKNDLTWELSDRMSQESDAFKVIQIHDSIASYFGTANSFTYDIKNVEVPSWRSVIYPNRQISISFRSRYESDLFGFTCWQSKRL